MNAARAAIATLAHGPGIALSLLTLVLVGQPIYANDTWIHLALGDAFLSQGPFLDADPYLFAAPGPPQPSSWLGSALMAGVLDAAGFAGLRGLHVLMAAAIGAIVWALARRESRSTWAASAVLLGFLLLSTWRLVQLRPDLFSMLATLALHPLLIAPRQGPGAGRILAAACLGALWANLHAAFLLGPVLVLGVAASLLALDRLPGRAPDPARRRRGLRLGVAGVVLLGATLLNPLGPSAHLAYLESGSGTLELGAVTDEWARTDLLSLPPPNRPPGWPAWLLSWASLVAVVAGGVRILRETGGARNGARGARPAPGIAHSSPLDPALYAQAVAGLAAALLATRFLWMEVFALVVGARILGDAVRAGALRTGLPSAALAVGLAGFGLAAIGLHLRTGDWPLVSRSLIANATSYAEPYYPARFNAFAVDFLADAGLEGRVYNPYPIGGFMGFWLAPRLAMSSSGTMNVEREAMQDFLAIAERSPRRAGESFAALLDRHGLDLFLGTGLPIELIPDRRGPAEVAHLEGEPGWMLVYRSLRSAVYLRRNERNRENLARVARYYAQLGVPFDANGGGLDLERLLAERLDWAIAQGIVPSDFAALVASVEGGSASDAAGALEGSRASDAAGALEGSRASDAASADDAHRLAMLYATLGLYERALAVDGRLVTGGRPGHPAAMRRSLLCLLRLGRDAQALLLAQRLDERALRASGRTPGWTPLVQELMASDPDQRAARLARLPFYRSEVVDRVLREIAAPEPRDPATRVRRRATPSAV